MTRRVPVIHERFLRHIWSKKYLAKELFTTDGERIEVRDVGEWNTNSGPDFLNARIIIDGISYKGDVEIHRNEFDWLQHNHQIDPHYNGVVLHVVLEGDSQAFSTMTASGRKIPVLVLSENLSTPLRVIWERAILDDRLERIPLSHCNASNAIAPAEEIERWISKLALERLELKLRRFEERLNQLAFVRKQVLRDHEQQYTPFYDDEMRNVPPPQYSITKQDVSRKELWEQLLYEGWMEALGYSHNREPMLRVAQALPLNILKEQKQKNPSLSIEALLFGVAGLLPSTISEEKTETRNYIQKLLEQWEQFRTHYTGDIVSESAWTFFPTRPANFPARRLAAGAALGELMLRKEVFREMIQCFKQTLSPRETEKCLWNIFFLKLNSFWQCRYSFVECSAKPLPALGISRQHEITVNVLLPIALLYARIFKDRDVRESAITLYQSLPPREKNGILRTMENNVVHKKFAIDSVWKQQGLIHLYKYYCVEHHCSECAFGKCSEPIL
ncbi:MAG TPA: DUF2851 family protein [Bacteroidota bacterium]|nr:DUF2851 family protein [Bacteroidota bacterium]